MPLRLVTIAQNIQDQSRLEASGKLIPEAWKAITTLNTGWVNFDVAGFNNPQYRKDPFGRVWLRGGIKQTVPGSVAQSALLLTLPAGYRPNNAYIATVASINGSSVVSVGALIVQPNGEVQAYTTNLHGTFVSLDGVTFGVT